MNIIIKQKFNVKGGCKKIEVCKWNIFIIYIFILYILTSHVIMSEHKKCKVVCVAEINAKSNGTIPDIECQMGKGICWIFHSYGHLWNFWVGWNCLYYCLLVYILHTTHSNSSVPYFEFLYYFSFFNSNLHQTLLHGLLYTVM
jgi:hypothetical protein